MKLRYIIFLFGKYKPVRLAGKKKRRSKQTPQTFIRDLNRMDRKL